MVIAIVDSNDCNFAIKFNDETQKDKIKEYMKAGLDAWYEAATDNIEGNEYFTADEIEDMFQLGYAEPTMELIERSGIDAECIDVEYDGETIKADEVIRYW